MINMKNIKSTVISLLSTPTAEEIQAVRETEHFFAIDLLRGFSAVVILIWHYQHFYYPHPLNPGSSVPNINATVEPMYGLLAPFYNHGYWAVQLFWIISGFVFAHVYAGKITAARDFAISRFARLYPLHVITLVFIGLIQILSKHIDGGYQVVTVNDPYDFFLNLFFISQWGFQSAASFNAPIWSVSIEMGIYALFFILARNIFSAGVVFSVVLVLFGYVIVQVGTPLWFFGMCSMFFFTGVLIFYLLAKCRNNKIFILSICMLSLAYFSHFVISGIVERKPFTNTEGYLLAPIVVLAGLIDISRIGKKTFQKLRWIGDATYSIYLWHFPIQVFVLTFLFYFSINRSFFNRPITLFIWIFGMLLIGRLSFRYIERPLQSAAKSWAYKNISVGPEKVLPPFTEADLPDARDRSR